MSEQENRNHQRGAQASRFSLGSIVATPGALRAFLEAGDTPGAYVVRHARGDWGEVDKSDWKANDAATRLGTRLLSSYILRDATRIWIITEADRSSTCILLPEEY